MRDERELKFSEIEFDDDDDECPIPDKVVFRDPVVRRVVYQFIDRSNVGYEKYGQTLDSERRTGVKNLGDYLQDVQEELMDAILYIRTAKEELEDKPQCNCRVKDVNNKTILGDLEALDELKRKMDERKVLEEKINRMEYYGSEYTSNQT